MRNLLESIEFRDVTRARRELTDIVEQLDPSTQNHIEALLAVAPDPDRALSYLSNLKQRHPVLFQSFIASHTYSAQLIAVSSHSHFLADELLQNPHWLQEITALDRLCSNDVYEAALVHDFEQRPPGMPEALVLAVFRRRHILRILLRDVLGLAALPEITEELSNLADAILQITYQRIREELIGRHGTPRYQTQGGETRECGMAVIALGKLGGQELNYSSDIDLMFIYSANGDTDGPNGISNKEFYKKVANQYTELLSTYTAEGLCYRVDLRLRPDGSLGEVCLSLEGARKYYQSRARDWELQMMIKARVAAGDRETGRELLEAVEPLTYSTTLDFSAVEAVSATRERISEKLNQRRGAKSSFDVKLARGGIRDIEFLVQCLQRLHGGRVPWVRHGGTMLALSRLNDKDLLSASEYSKLVTAYTFLRNLEHRLQFEDDRQTHTLPTDPRQLDLLARRMPMQQLGSVPSGEKLLQELNAHLESVQDLYERVIHAQRPIYYSAPPSSASRDGEDTSEPPSANLARFLDEKAPRLASVLSRTDLRLGARAFEHFLEKVVSDPHWLALLNDGTSTARFVFDLFEHSPYYADELIRTPELIEDLLRIDPPKPLAGSPERLELGVNDPADLRRLYRRDMFRVQAASLCLHVPVFETLARTSELADAAIVAAYRMALDHVRADFRPGNPLYVVGNQMMVVALGRLGMREFDLASDADLVFIVPDADHSEHIFWTRVANRIIDILTAYTSAGVMFAVDTRLRPNGSAGALVQSENSYKAYFEKNAEAWEGITYMKARAIAGDVDRATVFLNQLQEVDWRRYGQSGRSKRDLRQMRMRLEKEQGSGNPLKAGQGGYYDIDFLLMYLRLKAAGIFFKVLNTPERIDILEKMGHLERADAAFLQDAASFYRALDHGLRLYSGHAEGSLPNSETQLAVLTELVHRWTPDHLNHQSLQAQLLHVRNRTREIFDRLFS
ncbi:MAG: glutamine-synthetase adenylyltransferase [Acidobacteriota bacterium]|nr:glutamine-synthetase adenylyltransferase [Acidobacteriota bacterium]